MDVYKKCPIMENENFLLRLVKSEDVEDLWNVYSDKRAVPFFNSDNCDGDDFYYETLARMEKARNSGHIPMTMAGLSDGPLWIKRWRKRLEHWKLFIVGQRISMTAIVYLE